MKDVSALELAALLIWSDITEEGEHRILSKSSDIVIF